MSTLDSFLPEVRPWAPGVPDQTAYKAIRNAAIQFCERTRLWKWETTIAVLASEPATRPMPMPAGSAVIDIETAKFDHIEIVPKVRRDLDDIFPGWRTGYLGPGQPKYITQTEQNTITLVPAQMQDGSLYLCVNLKPSQTANELPAFLNDYAECIGWGALGRVLTVPGQSYTNPEMGTYYMGLFNAELDTLANKGTTGQQAAQKRSKARFF